MSLRFLELPADLVAQLDDPELFLREPGFDWAQYTTAQALGGRLLPQLLEVMDRELAPLLIVTSRPSRLLRGQCNGVQHWHTDYTVGYRQPGESVRAALYVAGEPRTLFRLNSGQVTPLPRGQLAVFDGGVEHSGGRAERHGARWLVRGLWLADGHPLRGRRDQLSLCSYPKAG